MKTGKQASSRSTRKSAAGAGIKARSAAPARPVAKPAAPPGRAKPKLAAMPVRAKPKSPSAPVSAKPRAAAASALTKPKTASRTTRGNPATTAPVRPARRPAAASPQNVADFMARAWAMEAEASERYAEFADQMEVHNNLEVADLFRKLARIEGKHRDQIADQMGWTSPPVIPVFRWEGPEGPETGDVSELHYLMQPYHALRLALHNEQRAYDFFDRLSKAKVPADVRAAALEMAEEEREHVELIREWMQKVPVPDAGWDEDLDPPVLSE